MKKLELNQMENIEGSMGCGLALGLFAIGFIGAAATTGGLGALAFAGMVGNAIGVAEACR